MGQAGKGRESRGSRPAAPGTTARRHGLPRARSLGSQPAPRSTSSCEDPPPDPSASQLHVLSPRIPPRRLPASPPCQLPPCPRGRLLVPFLTREGKDGAVWAAARHQVSHDALAREHKDGLGLGQGGGGRCRAQSKAQQASQGFESAVRGARGTGLCSSRAALAETGGVSCHANVQ